MEKRSEISDSSKSQYISIFEQNQVNDQNDLTPLLNPENEFKFSLNILESRNEDWKEATKACGIIRWVCIFHAELLKKNYVWLPDLVDRLVDL